MNQPATCNWPGVSGQQYTYKIYPLGTPFNEVPGNYIFAKEDSPGSRKWIAIYIGQTGNLNQRLENHEKEECAVRHGATHIHVHTSSGGENIRKREESDLIEKWNPVCNG